LNEITDVIAALKSAQRVAITTIQKSNATRENPRALGGQN